MAQKIELLMMSDVHWVAVQGPGAPGPLKDERPLPGKGFGRGSQGGTQGAPGHPSEGCSVSAGQASPNMCPPMAIFFLVPDSHPSQSGPRPLSCA